ncbi:MAG: carboxypeptidase-like regulatory domain-containing protein [Chitinophagales bacterium]|nr:carboxypeptidase-like regulatory domain-containing protein [Chitinophagales bacterium]
MVSWLIEMTGASAQQLYTIKGTVYDSSRNYPMPGVSVLTTSGRGTSTNSNGHYEVTVMEKDSIWFSYLNKPTIKFPVLSIKTPLQFDIALQISIPVLGEVKIRPPDYRLDSIRNRQEYAKIFDYKRPGLKVGPSSFGAGVGIDLDELINVFRFKRKRSMLSFQKRLIRQEQDKFVDHRFSKALVRRLTKLTGNELDSFMLLYRPSYLFTSIASDYDFQKYILDSFHRFEKGLPPLNEWKMEEDEF